jgi:hypothetical protein
LWRIGRGKWGFETFSVNPSGIEQLPRKFAKSAIGSEADIEVCIINVRFAL